MMDLDRGSAKKMSDMQKETAAHKAAPEDQAEATLVRWFDSPRGRYVLDWEQGQYDSAVDDMFGFHAVQVGLPSIDFLRENRIPLRIHAGIEPGSSLRAEATQLPLASHSMDLVVLPHVLEFAAHPHQILREAERVLRPEGQIVISGFNPLSLWGMKRATCAAISRSDRHDYPWRGRFIGLLRLKDWLALLGFELNGGRFGCYAPPFAQASWLERSRFMEKAGDRWWPIAGAVYVVRAVKRTLGMRLVQPAWREQAVKRPALVQVARRDNVIHVRPLQKRGRESGF
jgi:SAM-dependent methyltransferase